jgi:hypothetical protein
MKGQRLRDSKNNCMKIYGQNSPNARLGIGSPKEPTALPDETAALGLTFW